jgi:hypothetical protein
MYTPLLCIYCRKLWALIEPNYHIEKNDERLNNYIFEEDADNDSDHVANISNNTSGGSDYSNNDIENDTLNNERIENANANKIRIEKKKININYWFNSILPRILKRNEGRDSRYRKKIYVFIQDGIGDTVFIPCG